MALSLVFVARYALWRGVDDPGWEKRWRELDPADRTRIATATRLVTSRVELDEPEEAGLAEGFRRRDQRRQSYIELPVLLLLTTLGALWIAGSLPASTFYWFFWPLLIANLVWQRLRERHLNGSIRQVSPDAGL